jgi:hypothetical protein
MKMIVTLYLFLFSSLVQAQSLRAPIERVGQELQSIAQAVGLVGLIICGLHFMLGSQEASQKMTRNLLGFLIVVSAGAVSAFFWTLR